MDFRLLSTYHMMKSLIGQLLLPLAIIEMFRLKETFLWPEEVLPDL